MTLGIFHRVISLLHTRVTLYLLSSIIALFPSRAFSEWAQVGPVLISVPTGMSLAHDSSGNIKRVSLNRRSSSLRIELTWTTLGFSADPVRFSDAFFRAAKRRLERTHGLGSNQEIELRPVLGQKMKIISVLSEDKVHEVGLCILEKASLIYEATYSAREDRGNGRVVDGFLQGLRLVGSASLHSAPDDFPAVGPLEQPDYQQWKSITLGMSKGQVQKLVGEPDLIEGSADGGKLHIWRKAIVVPASGSFPVPYSFELHFAGDVLVSKSDPFNGRFSTGPKPACPLLITPQDGQVLEHYPRIMDLRWYPASGMYPLSYIVEVGSRNPGTDEWADHQDLTRVPYLNLAFAGSNRGRWRVKAVNAHGMSEWSPYWYFEFRRPSPQ